MELRPETGNLFAASVKISATELRGVLSILGRFFSETCEIRGLAAWSRPKMAALRFGLNGDVVDQPRLAELRRHEKPDRAVGA
jgi:hypothetical protein